MRRDIPLYLFLRKIVRIELAPLRHRRFSNKWSIRVENVPAAAIDPQQGLNGRVAGGMKKFATADVALPPIQVVQNAASIHQFLYQFSLACCERGGTEGHGDGLPSREALYFVVNRTAALGMRGGRQRGNDCEED